MARLSFVAAILAVAAGAAAQTTSLANPFTQAGIPPLSDLPICQTECATVAQAQTNWSGDYSSACTASFATSLQSCMSCVANSSIGQALLTPQTEQELASALTSYQTACQQAGSPVSINVSSILGGATSTGTGTATASNTGSASTASNTSSHNAGSKAQLAAGTLFGAVAVVAANLF